MEGTGAWCPPWAELRRGLGHHQAEPAQKSQARQLGAGLELGGRQSQQICRAADRQNVPKCGVGREGAVLSWAQAGLAPPGPGS